MRAVALLPYDWQITLGEWIGKLGLLFAKKHRHIVEVNIDLCFSWLSHQQRNQLIDDSFRSTGIGFVENVAKKYFQYEVIWITIFVMGMLGLLFDIALRKIITKTIPWHGKG